MDCGKVKLTKGDAHKAIQGGKRSKKFKAGHVYYCSACDAWHISSGGTKRGKGKSILNRKFVSNSQEYNVKLMMDKNSARGAGNENLKIRKPH